jgi:hypothetical protein
MTLSREFIGITRVGLALVILVIDLLYEPELTQVGFFGFFLPKLCHFLFMSHIVYSI